MNWQKVLKMRNLIIIAFSFIILVFSSFSQACGDNPNAIIQGPFKDSAFNDGFVCFQNTPDKRNIMFYLSYMSKDGIYNEVVDTYDYSDAPVELMSVFFSPVNGERNIVVLLRWNVNYENNGIQYPYFYEIKTYQKENDGGYKLNLDSNKDTQLSGYQTNKNGKIINYPLDNAGKIKSYLFERHRP